MYNAQLVREMDFILTYNPLNQSIDKEDFSIDGKETSELKLALTGTIRLYQLLISSQHNSICTFSPSCSRFGYTAITEYGAFYGIMMTSDRFQRCHGLSNKFYQISHQTGKLYDPVESYFWGLRKK